MIAITDKEILEGCVRACGLTGIGLIYDTIARSMMDYEGFCFDPLTDDGDCARMENKCGVQIDCHQGIANCYTGPVWHQEIFTPGNDEERRRAACLVVARAQIEKEKK